MIVTPLDEGAVHDTSSAGAEGPGNWVRVSVGAAGWGNSCAAAGGGTSIAVEEASARINANAATRRVLILTLWT